MPFLEGHPLYEYSASVLRVVDGDTIDLEIDLGFEIRLRERLRLFGIDTPEVFGSKAVPGGKLATAFTKAWTAEGKGFHLSSIKYNQREKYGRILGMLYREGDPIPLNEALLIAGLARKMTSKGTVA